MSGGVSHIAKSTATYPMRVEQQHPASPTGSWLPPLRSRERQDPQIARKSFMPLLPNQPRETLNWCTAGWLTDSGYGEKAVWAALCSARTSYEASQAPQGARPQASDDTQPSSLNSSWCCAGGNDRCTGLPGPVVVLAVRPGRSMLEGSETRRGSVATGQARGFGAELAEQLLKI